MRWVHSEYALKGVFIGLLLFVAVQAPTWAGLGRVALWMLGGLGIALLLGLADQIRRGQRFGGNIFAYLMFLLLEYPLLVYAGLILGLFAGAIDVRAPDERGDLLLKCALGGGILGLAVGEMRQVKERNYRLIATFALAAGGLGLAYYWLREMGVFENLDNTKLGVNILLGLPFFYLLVFASQNEESEVEIALLCAVMGVGIWLVQFPRNLPAAGFLLPAAIYYTYATYVLPGLRVFKHVLRGYSYFNLGRIRPSLLAFRRALELDPKSELAREGLWRLHRQIELAQLEGDEETLGLLDFRMCLERVRALLSAGHVPNADQRDESRRLLELVDRQRPEWKAEVLYHRALLAAHEKRIDDAVEMLREVVDPSHWDEGDKSRTRILLLAWQLALQWHPALIERVGKEQIDLPGRRMEAIAAVERRLAKEDPPASEEVEQLRVQLYADLREDEYFAAVKNNRPPKHFNHDYVEQLGLALIDDPNQWERGAAYLRMAGRGLRERAPGIFAKLAEAYERAGDMSLVTKYLEQVLRNGLEVGVNDLLEDQKKTFFQSVKRLGEEARAKGEVDQAIAHYTLYVQSGENPTETHRILAELNEQKGDILAALKHTETALVYTPKDADLLEKKSRYYYSLEPDTLKKVVKDVESYFDTTYCKRQAKQVLDARNTDADSLDWAYHLAQLARVMEPKGQAARYLVARCLLRRGERDAALPILEDIREEKPGSGEEEEAWYATCQHLGRLYLDELDRPDLAISVLEDYKNYYKSGADTIYHLGRAFEATGNHNKAKQCYEQVTAYEGHPRYYDARDALERLRGE